MSNLIPEKLHHHTCQLGEGPIWDHRNNEILWVDIDTSEVHRYGINASLRSTKFKKKVTALALKHGGGYVASVEDGFAEIDIENASLRMIYEIREPGNRFNDGKCDPAGRFWAGTTSYLDVKGAGNVYRFGGAGGARKMIDQVSISNGMAWSLNKREFYFIDTPSRKIWRYGYDDQTGDLYDKQEVFVITDGYPDGMTIDDEGMLWVALWDGWKVIRIDPFYGKLLSEIAMPVSRATSCAFGGKDLDELYISSARKGLSANALKKQPLAGSLFVLKGSGYKGNHSFEYKKDKLV